MSLFKLQLLLFISALFLWNILTPVLEGADEVGHYCQADYIEHRKKLPNLTQIDGCFLWHPPLYYLMLTPVVKAFNLSEFSKDDFVKNPNFDQLKHGEYSQYVHGKDELLFKWNKKVFQVHAMRLFSSTLGVLVFIITWQTSKYVFKKEIYRNLSLLIFFNPMFIHIFSTLTNVTLITLITTTLIALDIRYVNKKKKGTTSLLEGLLLGLGFITKITIVNILFAKAYLFFAEIKKSPKTLSIKLKEATIITIGFVLAAGWYLLRSKTLYGSISERDVIARIPTEYQHDLYVQSLGYVNYINSFFTTIFRTFWSGYGAVTVKFPDIINLVLLFLVILLAFTVFKKRSGLNPVLKISLIYVVSIFLGLMVNNLKLRAMHAKDLFPAYMPLAFLFSYALSNLPEGVKFINKSLGVQLLAFTLSAYFFAQSEIVKIVKFATGTVNDDLFSLLTALSLKIIVVLFVMQSVKYIAARVAVNKKAVAFYTLTLFSLDILTLSVASYLFYFRFL